MFWGVKQKIKVLHLFNTYLPNTENWAYRLIANTPNSQIFIAAKNYIEGSFPNDRFTFYRHPYEKIEALNEIGIALSAEKDTARLLEKILQSAKSLTNADGGTFYLVEKT